MLYTISVCVVSLPAKTCVNFYTLTDCFTIHPVNAPSIFRKHCTSHVGMHASNEIKLRMTAAKLRGLEYVESPRTD